VRQIYVFSHDRISVPRRPIGLAFEIPSAGCDSQGNGSRNIFPGVRGYFWGRIEKFLVFRIFAATKFRK
jgi:hypothetical protein